MDLPLTSTPSILVSDAAGDLRPRHQSSFHSSNSSISISHRYRNRHPHHPDSAPSSFSHGPMAIPRSEENIVPPPQPPPRFIEELANGHDSGWRWGNTFHPASAAPSIADSETAPHDTSTVGRGFGAMLPPINPGSSLFGGQGHIRPPLLRRHETFRLDSDEQRASASALEHDSALGPSSAPSLGPFGDGSASAFSPSSPPTMSGRSISRAGSISQTLDTRILPSTGHMPLSENGVERSISAYDRSLLSKIGGPTSPPRTVVIGLLAQGRDPGKVQTSFSAMTLAEESLSPQDMRWTNGPPSAGISPGTRVGSFSDYVAFRSQRENSGSGLSPMEVDQYSQAREKYGSSLISTSVRYGEASYSLPLHPARRSNERSIFPDMDADVPMDEPCVNVNPKTIRQRSLGERIPSFAEGISPLSNHGMKRRASSPPQIAPHEDVGLGTSVSDRRMSGFPFNGGGGCTSPIGGRNQSNHGSISSISSTSMRTGSYASSTGLSLGASSMSSYDRPSPGGVSPTDVDHYDRGFVCSPAQKSAASAPVSNPPRPTQFPEPVSISPAVETRKGSATGTGRKGSHTCPNANKNSQRVGQTYVCECCHAKPKKLDSLEELRAHEMEKQYNCNYCHKRFKNKNEAERHRSSLHIRHHSWSCGSLTGYESAFHPSTSTTAGQTPGSTIATHDVCGFCGIEFPNIPSPQWDVRIDHLTTIHKFGECNQSKKFWRADHLRQHLKHIHAGSSGKWTNILENACMKEEPMSEAALPSIGETPDVDTDADMLGNDGDGDL